jgi:hypothetical protein
MHIENSAVALFALPALDKLQQQRQQQQEGNNGATAVSVDAMPNSLREDLRWLSALW